MPDRDKEKRVRIQRRATIRLSGGGRVVVRTVDISANSLCIAYSAPAEMGAVLEIELGLPTKTGLRALKLHGQVYHSHLYQNLFYIRLRFMDMAKEERLLLGQFLLSRAHQRTTTA